MSHLSCDSKKRSFEKMEQEQIDTILRGPETKRRRLECVSSLRLKMDEIKSEEREREAINSDYCKDKQYNLPENLKLNATILKAQFYISLNERKKKKTTALLNFVCAYNIIRRTPKNISFGKQKDKWTVLFFHTRIFNPVPQIREQLLLFNQCYQEKFKAELKCDILPICVDSEYVLRAWKYSCELLQLNLPYVCLFLQKKIEVEFAMASDMTDQLCSNFGVLDENANECLPTYDVLKLYMAHINILKGVYITLVLLDTFYNLIV
ncbi:hypothetical protein RFI_08652 [Reticulomyxa filosa]|uniref:Alkyl hydroperoxide reductase subunit C/ Thiol specific antioxidant domain-containing protein n=1 Tax=Reticulomyxa filosa TaxID=46433 RepID=X6NT49_RETFI|nr:hypothetical protein RFI_08652 [Reticulomyxa filosa]|eukprot:ETO28482.1 hypothetical protein RFI_08652 [Reticulomyxa filosa]